jgi:CobQ-like glutamine amidotransferase family enzyme
MATSRVLVVLMYPELLGTYGDGGNALVLHQRPAFRGRLKVTMVTE